MSQPDVQALIRAQAALKRSEAYERAGDYETAYNEANAALVLVAAWRDSLYGTKQPPVINVRMTGETYVKYDELQMFRM